MYQIVILKIQQVMDKNKGFQKIQIICKKLNGSTTNWDVKQLMTFKYAPITSVDVERSFSMYKNILRSNRHSFLFENLSQQFIIYCNNNQI